MLKCPFCLEFGVPLVKAGGFFDDGLLAADGWEVNACPSNAGVNGQ